MSQTHSEVKITFRDELNRTTSLCVKAPGQKTWNQAYSLATNLDGWSKLVKARVNLQLITIYQTEGSGTISKKAILTGEDTNGKLHQWELPDYNSTIERDKYGEFVEMNKANQILDRKRHV